MNFLKKLGSRKFWLAIAGIATGTAMTFGVEGSEISMVAGAVTTLVSVVTYIVTEGKVDLGSAINLVKNTKEVVDAINNGESDK